MGEGERTSAVLSCGEHERVLVWRCQLWKDFSGSTAAVTDSPCRPPVTPGSSLVWDNGAGAGISVPCCAVGATGRDGTCEVLCARGSRLKRTCRDHGFGRRSCLSAFSSSPPVCLAGSSLPGRETVPVRARGGCSPGFQALSAPHVTVSR